MDSKQRSELARVLVGNLLDRLAHCYTRISLPKSICYAKEVAALDNTLYYLGRDTKDAVFDFVMMQGRAKVALLFQEVNLAEVHLAQLPEVSVQTLDDLRAKEEFLRAALQQGVTQVWFDTDAQSLEPQRVQPLAEALFYILSFRREAACL